MCTERGRRREAPGPITHFIRVIGADLATQQPRLPGATLPRERIGAGTLGGMFLRRYQFMLIMFSAYFLFTLVQTA